MDYRLLVKAACEQGSIPVEFVELLYPKEDAEEPMVIVYRWQTGFGYAYGVVNIEDYRLDSQAELTKAIDRAIRWHTPHFINGRLWTPGMG